MVEGKDEAKIKRSQGPIGESDPGRLTLSGGGRGLFRVGGSQSVDWVCVLLFFGGGGGRSTGKDSPKKDSRNTGSWTPSSTSSGSKLAPKWPRICARPHTPPTRWPTRQREVRGFYSFGRCLFVCLFCQKKKDTDG